MGTIEDVAYYLDSSSTAMTRGVDLFAHTLPETTADRVAVGLFERQPPPPIGRFGTGTPIRRHAVQVIVRSTMPTNGEGIVNPTNARARADSAWSILNGITNQTIQGSTYLRAEPQTEPFTLGQDERGRLMFSFTAIVWKQAGA